MKSRGQVRDERIPAPMLSYFFRLSHILNKNKFGERKMRLYDEIAQSEGFSAFAGARALFLPMRAVYLEGVKALGDFAPEKVVVCFPHCQVAVEGEELSIAKYLDGDLCIVGKPRSLSVLDGGRE